MTVMLPRFFGVPRNLICPALLDKLRPSALKLYLHVLERSEFFCSREIRLLDTDIRVAINVARRSLVRDRQQLSEFGLVQCVRPAVGQRYVYTLLDPDTKQPFPGDPKARIKYVRRPISETSQPELVQKPEGIPDGLPLKF